MGWPYSLIQTTARQISGQISNVSLTNAVLQQYINNYYQYDLPRELKIEELYQQYQFSLLPNVPTYDLPGDFSDGLAYTHIEPRVFINGLSISYTQDTNVFYSMVPRNFSTEVIAYGDGSTNAFTYTTMFQPIYSFPAPNATVAGNNVLITDGVESFADVPTNSTTGVLTGNLGGTGTVNYSTGAISVTFNTAPANQSSINVTYHFQQLAIPNTVLFYARQFTFYPTPDTVYQCRVDAYQQPQPLVSANQEPVKPEWGEIIAIGAALKILRDFGQIDKYNEVKIYYEKERSKLLSDTDNQLMAQRTQPRW